MNPWTPGFLARIPRLGFLAMIFNIMSTHTSVRSCSELTWHSDGRIDCGACAQQ
jgi:hypothetical protein